MMILEKSFPRGGIPKKSEKTHELKENINFGPVQTKVKKTKSSKKDDNFLDEDEDVNTTTTSAESLTPDTIQEGMLVMGVVKAIDQLYLTISLPGRLIARASALDISDSYTKVTNQIIKAGNAENYKPLTELYEVGQIVYGRIKELKQKDKNSRVLINMALKPSEVHGNLLHTNIRKGFVFNGAVEEVQEHGYIIETGIKGLRTFLPVNKSKQGHATGQLIPLKVEKITSDKAVSTCQCREIKLENSSIKCNQSNPNLDYILPTTIVNFQVSKILKNGLQGTIMEETFTACVNEHQLNETLALPEDFTVGQNYKARILYVMPLTKIVFLTLQLSQEEPEAYKRGDIIENAKVHHLGTGGVVLVIDNKYKGLIPYKIIKSNYKGNYDQDELLIKYATKTEHKVRILDYDPMDGVFVCTDDRSAVKQKIFVLEDLKPGEFVTAIVKQQNTRIGGYTVQVGKIKGIIEKLYLAVSTKPYEENTKIRCRVVSTDDQRKIVYLTNRPEYMQQNAKLLYSNEMIRKNAVFLGTIVKNESNLFIVKFFNNIKGILLKQQILEDLLSVDEYDDFYEGQVMSFRIASFRQDKLYLGVAEVTFNIGEIYSAKIQHVLESGLQIQIKQTPEDTDQSEADEFNECKGLVPTGLLSEFNDLLGAKLRTFESDSTLDRVVCLHRNIFSLRDVEYFEGKAPLEWKQVKIGDVLRAFVKNVQGDIIEVLVPIRGYGKLVKLHLNMLLMKTFQRPIIDLVPEQVIYVKIVGKEDETRTVSVSARLTDVWSTDFVSTSQYVKRYLLEVENLGKCLQKKKDALAKYSIGDKITIAFEGVNAETNYRHYVDVKTKVTVIVKSASNNKKKSDALPEVGKTEEAVVIWIDYSNNLIYASTQKVDIAHISQETFLPTNLVGAKNVSAKILLKLDHIFICSLKKGPAPLVICPIRLHYNDFECAASINAKEGEICKLTFIDSEKPIAILHDAWKAWHLSNAKATASTSTSNVSIEKNPKKKKTPIESTMKIYNDDDVVMKNKAGQKRKTEFEVKTKSNSNEASASKKIKKNSNDSEKETMDDAEETNQELFFFEDKQPDKQELARIAQTQRQEKKESKATDTVSAKLPGISDFWTMTLSQVNQEEDSSSDSDSSDDSGNDSNDEGVQKKRKKLSAVEQFKKQREEENKLREIEEKYADESHQPESVDQFDRLVLAEPNNSKHWINYMVFHLQFTEIDKARAVARRALKAIAYRNTDELLNIWIALLNLELRYGSDDSFNDTLREALTLNEPLKVYLRTIEILQNANKSKELIDMVNLVTKKFKSEPEIWKVAAAAFFSIGVTEKAQQLLHRALASLPEREHVNTIVMFANLNHKYGCNEMAHTLFDQIVVSYPKRVDVWSQYIDTLVKDELIESARNVLERAVIQKIPIKKMRTIFKKYLEFEQRFGSPEDVEKVKKLAVEFVQKNTQL